MKHHLIICAHPSPRSFSNLLTRKIAETTVHNGWTSHVRDLYAMGFNPVLSPNDLQQLKGGQTPVDIAEEQKLVAKADMITMVFPLWWASYPAIIKGYIDRVLTYGFAYKNGPNGIEGLLTGKKVLLFTSMGNSIEQYEEKNLLNAFEHTLGHEVFGFCGMEIVNHEFFPQIPDASDDVKQQYADKALAKYNGLW